MKLTKHIDIHCTKWYNIHKEIGDEDLKGELL